MASRAEASAKASGGHSQGRPPARRHGGGDASAWAGRHLARPLSEGETTRAGDAALAGRGADLGPASAAAPASPAGKPLPAALRRTLEGGFGQDLSGLRVHQGEEAKRLTGALGTPAATRGSDLYFGPGQFRPADPGGRRIIAHEVAHAAEQRATGQTRLSAWPGPPDWTPLARAKNAIAARAMVLLRGGLSAEETPDLIDGLHAYLDAAHGDEVSEDQLLEMHLAVDGLSSVTAADPDPSIPDPIDPVNAVVVLATLLGQPREVTEDFTEVSFGIESFIRWCASGIAEMVTQPISATERDFADEFAMMVDQFTDPWSLMNLELEGTIDELIWLRKQFNASVDPDVRSDYGEQIGVAARRVLLLNQAMDEIANADDGPMAEESPLDAALALVMPEIEEARSSAENTDTTLAAFGDSRDMLSPQSIEAAFPALQEDVATTKVLPEEAFPLVSDTVVESLTGDLAERVTGQAGDVTRAREAVLPASPSYSLAEAHGVYRRWFQFYSPLGRDSDAMYQMVDQSFSDFSNIANMVDEGAFLHPILMSQWQGLVSGVIGTAQSDFSREIPRVRSPRSNSGDAYSPDYGFAELFVETGGSLSAAGERSSRRQVLQHERATTRSATRGTVDAWTYLITTEHMDGSASEETKYLDPETAEYLLARTQALSALEQDHTPGFGDSRGATGGVEHGLGTGAQRFLEGEPNTVENDTVESSKADIESAARTVGASPRNAEGRRDRTSASDVTSDLIRDLTGYLDTYFASEADVPEKLTLTLLISDAEYGSFAGIRDALTPGAIAQGLAMAMGMKGLEIAMTRLASRAVAISVMRGLGRVLTVAFGSDISQMAQLGTFLFQASQSQTLHQARTMAYFGKGASVAIGNLLQSLVVSTAMAPVGKGMEIGADAVAQYAGARPPNTARELTDMLAPFIQDPAARETVLSSVRDEIATLEANTDPNSTNVDLETLRAVEADLAMRSVEGVADAADVTLAHDMRTPAERMAEVLQREDLTLDERAAIEQAIANAPPDPGAAPSDSVTAMTHGDPALTQALGVPGMAVTRDPFWDSAGVKIEYTTRDVLGISLIGEISVRAGANADPHVVAMHGRTVRRMQKLQGLSGACRRVWSRVSALWSRMPDTVDRPGSVGFEVRGEIDKLPGLIQVQQARLDAFLSGEHASPLDATTAVELNAQIASLRQQLRFYEAVASDMAVIAEGGQGYIAALDYRDDFVTRYSRGGNRALINTAPGSARPHSGEATITEDFGSSRRGDNATAIGRAHGTTGDHGGHVFAHRFFGDVPDQGIIPQAGNLNTGAWKKMENEWAGWVNTYGPAKNVSIEIFVYIELNPPGAARPDSIDVVYEVTAIHGNGTREVVHFDSGNFVNASGQTYTRMYFRSDGTPYRR